MTRDPATPAELHAAAVECADASVAMYEAQHDAREARSAYMWALTEDAIAENRPTLGAQLASAEQLHADTHRRHRAATQAWLAIKPTDPKENP